MLMLTTNPEARVREVVETLDAALTGGDVERVVSLFADVCYWRDLVGFTWNILALEGRDAIGDMLTAQLGTVQPSNLRLDPSLEVETKDGCLCGWLVFETAIGRGEGHIRVDKDGKIYTLLTALSELKGYEEPVNTRRTLGVTLGHGKGRKTWKEGLENEARTLGYTEQPYVVIIGGGQGGMALGARLRMLGVPTIIVEKNERAGDSWRNRYKSLHLHDPVWYDHLPYMEYPTNWPVFPSKDKMGDWLEFYARIMELNYWTRSTVQSAGFDEATGTWTVTVDRDGETVTLKPKQLVFATGMAGKPILPTFKGMDRFKGEQQHSSAHPGPDRYRGKKVVVIGSNTSAHDICAAMWENDIDVTMVQRSATHVIRTETLTDLGFRDTYSEAARARGITVHRADMISASMPYAIMHINALKTQEEVRERDADLYEGLEKAGFQHFWGDDGSGIQMLYLRRGAGYYIDIGASQLIIDGEIKLKSNVEVEEIVEEGVKLSDGTTLPADLIIYATGFGSMNGFVADVISQEVADKVGKVWGLGSGIRKDPGPWEGEQRNMWKPTQQEALWFHGGNLHQSRHYSQCLALQLKARMEGLDTPVYGLAPVHHTS
ncbi:MAG: NAD(P)/FAD-dependent oxidoreductase [Acuticoccus sp.]